MVVGLTGAAYAASGAGHNFNNVVIQLSLAKFVHEVAGVSKGVGHANFQGEAVYVNGGFLYAVQAAYGGKLKTGQGFAGKHLIHSAEGGLHHAAGCAEYGTCAGGFSHGGVEVGVRKALKVYVGALYEAGQFTGGD